MKSTLNRDLLRIALPAIVSNITTPVLGLIDVAIVGHFGSAAFIGAIAVGGTMFNMLYWLFGFLRMGTAGMTAQACGARDGEATSASLVRSLAVALVAGLALVGLSAVLGPAALRFVDADPATEVPALRYFSICIWGAPAVLGMYALNGWWLGMQDSRTPMWVSIGINLANIAASLTLVFGLGLRIEGVALGTLAAQWLGFMAGIVVTWRRFRPSRPPIAVIADGRALRRMFSINADIFLRTLCLVAVTVWFTRAGASQGVTVLAANALLMQLFMFFSYFSDGFAFAGEALAGRCYGAGDSDGLRQVIGLLLRWAAGLAIVFAAAYFGVGEAAMGLLTDDGYVVDAAREYLPWAASVPLAGAVAFIYDGIFIGLTRTRAMLGAMAVSTATYFAVYLALMPLLGNHGLWAAFIVYLGVRSAVMHYMAKRKQK